MPRNRKERKFQIKVYGDTAVARSTDVRENFGFLVDELLNEFKQIVVERNGQPIAVIRKPGPADRYGAPEIRTV